MYFNCTNIDNSGGWLQELANQSMARSIIGKIQPAPTLNSSICSLPATFKRYHESWITYASRWIMNGTKSFGNWTRVQFYMGNWLETAQRSYWGGGFGSCERWWHKLAAFWPASYPLQFCLVSAKFPQYFVRRIPARSRASACTIWKMMHHILTLYAHKAFRARKLRQFSGSGKYILIISHLDEYWTKFALRNCIFHHFWPCSAILGGALLDFRPPDQRLEFAGWLVGLTTASSGAQWLGLQLALRLG